MCTDKYKKCISQQVHISIIFDRIIEIVLWDKSIYYQAESF